MSNITITTESIEKIDTPKTLGVANKDIKVQKIEGIKINKFRNMSNQLITLGDRITVFSGHNGTMKSTLIGLFVQPFNSNALDIYKLPLKTPFGNIFRLSSTFDKEKYEYDIFIKDEEGIDLKIPVYTKPRSKSDPSIRIVTGGNTKADGNLNYNTSFLNLNRLYSIHTSNAAPEITYLSEQENKFITDFYNSILLNGSYENMESIRDKSLKQTFGPTSAKYNYESISSGEDNLGRIAHSLISFMRLSEKNTNKSNYNGILCIDEVEASLHPVAQINLFNFLYKWSKKYRVQLIVNTHSLPLIKHSIEKSSGSKEVLTYYLSNLYSEEIQVIPNPEYEKIYQEFTFDYNNYSNDIPKIDIICEDSLAVKFMRYMISKQDIIKRINFIQFDEESGLPYTFLIKLVNNANSLLKNSIIIFDADVPESALRQIKNKNNICQLPDKSLKLPIEKLFVRYIFEKPKDDDFFIKKLKMPKEAVINTFIQHNIKINNLSDIAEIDTRHFKNWFVGNNNIVKKAFNSFSKDVSGREDFVKDIIEKINKISTANGYPLISY